jgi:subtilase family serine protease
LDAFAAAIQSNKADSIADCWGGFEWLFASPDSAIVSFSGRSVTFAQAAHELFVLAALQGQSLFAAAGNDGAYSSWSAFSPPAFNVPLSVAYPGSDTAMTAAGGTTLPATLNLVAAGLPNFPITIKTERVFGWDYFKPLCDVLNIDLITCAFPEGSGGGVSVFFPVPFYQQGIAGVQTSQPGQALIEEDTTPPQTIFVFSSHFQGRNVPDIAFNADPFTGYTLFYTSDVDGFQVFPFYAGTSTVTVQLAGVTALLTQNAGHRLGLLNPLLYGLTSRGATHDPDASLNTITVGDNWFYSGRNGYSPAAGLGTLNVAHLAKLLGK